MQDAKSERQFLRQLHRARRAHRGESRDWIDASYELWLRGFLAIGIVVGVPALLAGHEIDPSQLSDFRRYAPGVLAILLALAVTAALLAGTSGGPLSPESADVAYLLLGPISTERVLRPLAVRQWQTALVAGVLGGAAAGGAAARRLPEGPGAWIPAAAIAGILIASLVWGAIALASATRLPRWGAALAGLALTGLAVVDLVAHTWIAPTSWIATIAFAPLAHATPDTVVLPILGALFALAVPIIAIVKVGNTALEPLARRSPLVSQMRFAASMQDARTVVLLHRQLALEVGRRKPWIRWNGPHVRYPAWRRGWHGYLRWPARRAVRVVVLGVLAASFAVAARSTPLLIVLAGICAFVAALDVIEPFASELDQPTRLSTYGVDIDRLLAENLAAPVCVLLGIGIVIGAVGLAIGAGWSNVVVLTAICAPLGAIGGAALNVALGPPTVDAQFNVLSAPEIYGIILIARQAGPPVLAAAGLAPLCLHAWAPDATSAAQYLGIAVIGAAVASLTYATRSWAG